jgi:flagellar biosynthesis/type III secretory pathway M-ring protein FliF/YscJ
MGFQKGLGLQITVALLICGVLSSTAQAWGKKKVVQQDAEERVLIVGVPAEFQAPFVEYLVNNQVDYRFDSKTRTFYVKTDPVPVLQAARRYEVLDLIAQRGLWERQIEKEFRIQWPEVEDPRVCVSLPTYFPKEDKGDAEPVAFVLAQGLSKEEVTKAKDLVASRVPGLPVKNISVVGTNWRPGPSYEKGTKRIASVR